MILTCLFEEFHFCQISFSGEMVMMVTGTEVWGCHPLIYRKYDRSIIKEDLEITKSKQYSVWQIELFY